MPQVNRMPEMNLLFQGRCNDGAFLRRYFVGNGIDILPENDDSRCIAPVFPLVTAMRVWAQRNGDAQTLPGLAEGSLDFLHAGHCLQDMQDPRIALANWVRVVRPGGYLVISVPDEDASQPTQAAAAQAGWTFTTCKRDSWAPCSINMVDLVAELAEHVELERLVLVRSPLPDRRDAAIECVLRRREKPLATAIRHGAANRSLIPPMGNLRVRMCQRGVMAFDIRTEGAARILDFYGEYAEGELRLVERMLKPDDTVIDATAGPGIFAITAAQCVGPRGRVIAFEATAADYRLLVTNATLNSLPQLDCHHASLGAGLTVDSLGLQRCRLIRMDAQADAAALLRSGQETIRRCAPFLHLGIAGTDQALSVKALLDELGYQSFWRVVPLVQDQNFYARPLRRAEKDSRLISILGAPAGITIMGLAPVRSGDWQADRTAHAAGAVTHSLAEPPKMD